MKKIKFKAKLLENLIIMKLCYDKESNMILTEANANSILEKTAQEIESRLEKSGLKHPNDRLLFIQNIGNQLTWNRSNFALSFPDEKCSAKFLEKLSCWQEVELKQLKLRDLGER
jgi:hypothetical protein